MFICCYVALSNVLHHTPSRIPVQSGVSRSPPTPLILPPQSSVDLRLSIVIRWAEATEAHNRAEEWTPTTHLTET